MWIHIQVYFILPFYLDNNISFIEKKSIESEDQNIIQNAYYKEKRKRTQQTQESLQLLFKKEKTLPPPSPKTFRSSSTKS